MKCLLFNYSYAVFKAVESSVEIQFLIAPTHIWFVCVNLHTLSLCMYLCAYSQVCIHRSEPNTDSVNPRNIAWGKYKLNLQWSISNRNQSFAPVTWHIILALRISDWVKTCRINVFCGNTLMAADLLLVLCHIEE